MRTMPVAPAPALLLCLALAGPLHAQGTPEQRGAVSISAQYRIVPNVVYGVSGRNRSASPVLTIHGDADPVVPYTHALRLQDALDRAGVPNRLHTVPGGGHGNFTVAEYQDIYETVRQFLAEHVTE